ncbi:UPF0029-domain-containing protein, partial [Clavulina sp. PMI_390]
LCASIPPSYPTFSSGPPQLQLLSRYIGAFGVDADIFGAVMRTFISRNPARGEPSAGGEVVIFDGVESIRALLTKWYSEKASESAAAELARADNEMLVQAQHASSSRKDNDRRAEAQPKAPVGMPEGVELFEGPPIQDRGSAFVARVCRISDPSQVPQIIEYLRENRHIARAAHPTINAWRCTVNGTMHNDNDDDGESAAGSRLAHLLQILELDHVLVVVTRYFGGIHLGPDRFKHINQCARDALELAGFLN